jgi:3-oxoacyl-[acyl-carrier-protein] synthase II
MEVAVTGLSVAGAGLSEPEDLWRRMGTRGADGTPAAPEPYDPTPELGRGMRYKDRATKLALLAADRALRSAGGGEDRPGRAETTAVVASSNFGNLDTVCEAASVIARSSVSETSAMELPNASSNVIGSSIAIRHGLRGPNVMLCNGAASGLDAVHLARTLLAAGRADRVLVVGTEAAGAAVARWHGLSTQELFDGAAALVLEDAAAAAADGRPVRVLVDAFSRRLGARASASAALAGGAAKPSLWLTGGCPDPDETREGPDPAPAWGLPPWRDVEAVFGPAFGALGVLQAVAAAHRIAGHGDPAVLVTAGGGTAEAAASLLLTSAGPA